MEEAIERGVIGAAPRAPREAQLAVLGQADIGFAERLVPVPHQLTDRQKLGPRAPALGALAPVVGSGAPTTSRTARANAIAPPSAGTRPSAPGAQGRGQDVDRARRLLGNGR